MHRAPNRILLQSPLKEFFPFSNELHGYYCTNVAASYSMSSSFGGKVLTQKFHIDKAPEGTVITPSFIKSFISL